MEAYSNLIALKHKLTVNIQGSIIINNKWQQAMCLEHGTIISGLIDINSKEMKNTNFHIHISAGILFAYVAIYWLNWFKRCIPRNNILHAHVEV